MLLQSLLNFYLYYYTIYICQNILLIVVINFFQKQSKSAMNNQYLDLYRTTVHNISPSTTMNQAQQMVIQMSLIYNAFGSALKDLVHLLSILYPNHNQQQQPTTLYQKQPNINNKPKENYHLDDIDEKQKQIQKDVSQNQSSHPKSCYNFDKYKLIINEIQNHNKDKINYHNIKPQKYTKTTKQLSKKSKQQPFTRIEIARGKRQRQQLNGYSCTMCQTFYKALGQDYLDSNGKNRLCNECSRHRSNLPPTNFFSDFSQEFGFED